MSILQLGKRRSVSRHSKLTEYFELLISAYQRDAGGKLLIQWFREDWGMFQHARMDDLRVQGLLTEILGDK